MRLLFWKKTIVPSTKKYKRINPRRDYFIQINQLQLKPDESQQVLIIWLEYFLYLNQRAKLGKSWNYAAQITTIVLGLSIPFLTQLPISKEWTTCQKLIVAAMGLIITLVTALSRLFHLNVRVEHFRHHAETIRREGEDFLALIRRYGNYETHKDALKPFCTYVSQYRLRELNQYVDKIDDTQDKTDDNQKKP